MAQNTEDIELEKEFFNNIFDRYSNRFSNHDTINLILSLIQKINIYLFTNCCNLKISCGNTQKLRKRYLELVNSVEDVKKHDVERYSFELTERNDRTFISFIAFQTIVAVSTVLSVIICSSHVLEQYALTNTNTYIDCKETVCVKFLDLEPSKSNISSLLLGNNSDLVKGYEQSIYDKYRGFCIWRTRNINPKILQYFFILLSNGLMTFTFMQLKTLIAVLVSYTVFGNLFVTLSFDVYQFDVPVFIFLYDPRFTATSMHHHVRIYLSILNDSFRHEYSSLKQLLTQGESMRFDYSNKSRGHCDRIKSNSVRSGSVQHLELINEREFDLYVPNARSQSWRRLILVVYSISMFILGVLGSVLGLIAYQACFISNSEAARLNVELKDQLQGLSLIEERKGDQSLIWLANKLFSFVSVSFKQLNITDRHQDYMGFKDKVIFISNILAPTEEARGQFFSWPLITALVSTIAIWAATAFSVLVITIADLIIWVIILQIKLGICIVTLGYYDTLVTTSHKSIHEPVNSTLAIGGTDSCWLEGSPDTIDGQQLIDSSEPRFNARFPRGSARSTKLTISISDRSSYSNSARYKGISLRDNLTSTSLRGSLSLHKDYSNSPIDIIDTVEGIDRFEMDKVANNNKKVASDSDIMKTFDFDQSLTLIDIVRFSIVNKSTRDKMLKKYANRLIDLDRSFSYDTLTNGKQMEYRASNRFIISTYLDFRLFRDLIRSNRRIIDLGVMFGAFQGPIMLALMTSQADQTIKAVSIFLAVSTMCVVLFGFSFFTSQSGKLSRPIFSLLAMTVRGNERMQFLSQSWRKCIEQIDGPKSLFNLEILSVRLSYATSIEVSQIT